jgi:hypothetical protein
MRSVPRLSKESQQEIWSCVPAGPGTKTVGSCYLAMPTADCNQATPSEDINYREDFVCTKYPVVRPSWALKPGLTDRLVVGRKVTLS